MKSETHSILHRIEIESPIEDLFAALTSQGGLASWWTPMVEAEAEQGAVLRFRFGDGEHGPDMRITTLIPNERVEWACIDGPWKGMDFNFEIRPHERGSELRFAHTGWSEPDDFYMHCNAKWGFFLAVSLKSYLETGVGKPHPNDPSI